MHFVDELFKKTMHSVILIEQKCCFCVMKWGASFKIHTSPVEELM